MTSVKLKHGSSYRYTIKLGYFVTLELGIVTSVMIIYA